MLTYWNNNQDTPFLFQQWSFSFNLLIWKMAKRNETSKSPTTEDNFINRVIHYLGYCVHEFSVKGSKVLLVSMDKSNTDSSSYEKYLSKGIESSIGAGGALVAGMVARIFYTETLLQGVLA